MAIEDLEMRDVAMDVIIAPAPQVMRLIHADMDAAAAQRPAPEIQDLGGKLVGLFAVSQHGPAGVADILIRLPAQDLGEVAEKLDAADHLDAQLRSPVVDLAQLIHGIGATHIAEVRLALHLEGVLAIKVDGVVPHQRQTRHIGLQVRHGEYAVARQIQHDAQPPEGHGAFAGIHPHGKTDAAQGG